jgi:hypothetical protein
MTIQATQPNNRALVAAALALLAVMTGALSIMITSPASAHSRNDDRLVPTQKAVTKTPHNKAWIALPKIGGEVDFRSQDFSLESKSARPFGTPMGHTGDLTNGRQPQGFINTCVIDFNNPNVIQYLPGQASDMRVYEHYYNDQCGWDGIAIAVQPIRDNHFHMSYTDLEGLSLCQPSGQIGRLADPDDIFSTCTPIDPLTEPRSGVQAHSTNHGIRIFAYDISTRDRVQFDLNQLRIRQGQAEVCFQHTDIAPWITTDPASGPTGTCGMLSAGTWDVSDTVTDAYELRIWARSNNMVFTDLGFSV